MCLQDLAMDQRTATCIYQTQNTITIPGRSTRLAIRLICDSPEIVTLSVVTPPIIGDGTKANVPLGRYGWFPPAIGTDGAIMNGEDITLRKVGNILLGQLELNSANGATVWAIETYLDVPQPNI